MTRAVPCGSVSFSHAMNWYSKLRQSLSPKPPSLFSSSRCLPGFIRIDCNLFAEYLCQHLLLCDTHHRCLHRAPACALLDDRMDPEANGNPTIRGAIAPIAVPPIRGTTPLFLQMRGASSCSTWMASPPAHWTRAPRPWLPGHSHSSLSLHFISRWLCLRPQPPTGYCCHAPCVSSVRWVCLWVHLPGG